MIVVGFLALFGLGGYGVTSMRSALEDRIGSLEAQMHSMQNDDNTKVSQLTSDLDTVTNRLGTTAQELQQSHTAELQLKQENTQTAQRLRRELAAKADEQSVAQLRDESASKLAETADKLTEVQQDATTKIAGVSGDVQNVRTDLNATRDDLANSKRDLNSLIAHNSTELAELRRRGERDYVEFDINKTQKFERLGDVQVQLKRTDVKKQKFDVAINADDANILKKDRTANEPITFLVGRDRLRYELIVNYVDKDRIRGYLSIPKDKALSAEAPKIGSLQ
jgi:DNA repair exonuclease SbcCD ATPase subunit